MKMASGRASPSRICACVGKAEEDEEDAASFAALAASESAPVSNDGGDVT